MRGWADRPLGSVRLTAAATSGTLGLRCTLRAAGLVPQRCCWRGLERETGAATGWSRMGGEEARWTRGQAARLGGARWSKGMRVHWERVEAQALGDRLTCLAVENLDRSVRGKEALGRREAAAHARPTRALAAQVDRRVQSPPRVTKSE